MPRKPKMTRYIKGKILRFFKVGQRQRPQNCVPPLLEMPFDIIHLLLPHLPLVSQACLALTCKPLYSLLRYILDDEQLAWPRFLASRPCEPDCLFRNEPHLPRIQLLLTIENESNGRWLYCSLCLKLHPKRRFSKAGIKRTPSISRTCSYGVGVVDLCACLALTFFDGIQLTEWLKTGTPSRDLHQNIRDSFEYRVLGNKPALLHRCSITSEMDAFVGLAMMVELDALSGELIATTRYHVRWTTPHVIPPKSEDDFTYEPSLDSEPVALCLHDHAIAWLYKPRASQSCWGYCLGCPAKVLLLDCADDGLSCVIQGVRYLWHEYCGRVGSGCRHPWNPIWKMWYFDYLSTVRRNFDLPGYGVLC